jgi:hypothetical protein
MLFVLAPLGSTEVPKTASVPRTSLCQAVNATTHPTVHTLPPKRDCFVAGLDQLSSSRAYLGPCAAMTERTPTNRIVGRVTASQIAAASEASFCCRRIYGFT